MATIARTDIHRPSSPDFDPEAYELIGLHDNHPEDGTHAAHIAMINSLIARGFRHGPHSSHQCGHCGTPMRYSAVLLREDVGEYIHVGETCLTNRFEDMTKAQFQALRAAAQLNRERRTKAERAAQFAADHPGLAVLAGDLPEDLRGSDFLSSLSWQVRDGRELSPRQIEAATTAIERQRARHAARLAEQARQAARTQEYLGEVGAKIDIDGVVRVARVDTDYRYSYHGKTEVWLVIETERGDATLRTTAAWAFDVERGDAVRLTATVKAHREYQDHPQTVITRARVRKEK